MVNCLIFADCYFQLCRKSLQNFHPIKKCMMLVIIDKNIFKAIALPNNLLIFACFKAIIILCSVHSIWFVKLVFSAKIWFVKTLTRIMRYQSQVAKLNPDYAVKSNEKLLEFASVDLMLKRREANQFTKENSARELVYYKE